MKVLFLPLDERPCNYKFPELLAKSSDFDLVNVPLELLGNKKQSADINGIVDFLMDNAKKCDIAIISADMLVYGGLVPSRVHNLQSDCLQSRLSVLEKLKKVNPNMTLFVFCTVMRAPAYNSSDEEPDYYAEYGRSLYLRAYLSDKKIRCNDLTQLQEKELESFDIPQYVIDDYENRRDKNLGINISILDLVANNTIDYLIFPQDDSSPYGYTAVSQRRLQSAVYSKRLNSRVAMYPGSDEVGMTLLARAFCKSHRIKPAISVEYSSILGTTIVPSYEDRPMFESLKSHVLACGARLLENWEDSDLGDLSGLSGLNNICLMINAPGKVMQEAEFSVSNHDVAYDTYRNLDYFTNHICTLVESGKKVALCDSAYSNGGDLQLLTLLDDNNVLDRIISYAGWNTNCNTLGTVLSQAILGIDSKSIKKNIAYRIIEDALYQSNIRWNIANRIDNYGGNYFDVKPCEAWAKCEAKNLLQKEYSKLNLSKALPLKINNVDFPWKRMFEVNFDLL